MIHPSDVSSVLQDIRTNMAALQQSLNGLKQEMQSLKSSIQEQFESLESSVQDNQNTLNTLELFIYSSASPEPVRISTPWNHATLTLRDRNASADKTLRILTWGGCISRLVLGKADQNALVVDSNGNSSSYSLYSFVA